MAEMHAAMGHAPASQDEPVSGSSTASSGQSCAFAGAGALAGFLPEHSSDFTRQTTERALPVAALQTLRLSRPPRLRPPGRARCGAQMQDADAGSYASGVWLKGYGGFFRALKPS